METLSVNIGNFHHIGVVTHDIVQATKVYNVFGLKSILSSSVKDFDRFIEIDILGKPGHPLVELIEPIDERSPVNRLLKQFGSNCYHTCYEVDDLGESIEMLRKQQFVLVCEPSSAVLFGHRQVAFLFQKYIGLVELLQK
jgi:methylmalonyl-CoA/ethylmalonyl-CoA epimerase